MTLSETVADGDLRASLQAIRDHLASELDEGASCKKCGGVLSSPTAALTKQLAQVIETIDRLPVKEGSTVDDLSARRRKRRSNSPQSAAKG